jgi:predicted metalloprotease
MTFNEGSDISGGRTSRRGRNTAIGIGGGGLGILAIVLIGQLLGVDLSGLVGTGAPAGGGGSSPDSSLEQCQTGEDANENLDCRMKGAAASLEVFWDNTLADGATPTSIQLFTGATDTGCGGASSAVGPFYCPRDQVIYIDTAFFDQLRQQFGSSGGPLAQLYVVGHEWGHHIQNITGIMSDLNLQDSGPTSDGVRLELQADCFAGAWIAGASTTLDDDGVRRYAAPRPPMYTTPGEAGFASPVVVNDVVLMSTSRPAIYAFDAESGLPLWTGAGFGAPIANSFTLGPAVYGDFVVVGSANLGVLVFSL